MLNLGVLLCLMLTGMAGHMGEGLGELADCGDSSVTEVGFWSFCDPWGLWEAGRCPHREVHVLISGACEYVNLHG